MSGSIKIILDLDIHGTWKQCSISRALSRNNSRIQISITVQKCLICVGLWAHHKMDFLTKTKTPKSDHKVSNDWGVSVYFLIKYLVDLRKIDIVKAMTVISAITKV